MRPEDEAEEKVGLIPANYVEEVSLRSQGLIGSPEKVDH